MKNIDIRETYDSNKHRRWKIIFIYAISTLILGIYFFFLVGSGASKDALGSSTNSTRIHVNIAISIMGIVSCLVSYIYNKKDEVFIMSLVYVLFSIDILNSKTTGYLTKTTYEYSAIITSFIRVCIAYIACSNMTIIKDSIINNKKKYIVLVSIIGYIAIKIEYNWMMPYSNSVVNFYKYYNIFIAIVYILIAVRYFVKSKEKNEYIYGIIGISVLLFAIKALYDLQYIIQPSLSLSIRGDSTIIFACVVYIVGLFLELGETTQENKKLDEQRMLFIKIIDENKHTNTIICDENYTINYKNKRATQSLKEVDCLKGISSELGNKLDIDIIFDGELDTDTIDYYLLLDNNYRQEIHIKDTDSILDVSIHLIEVNDKTFKVIILKDISTKYKLEKTLLENEMIKQDEKIKNEFFSNISHELKTPLNIIYSTSQLLDISIDKDDFKDIYSKYSNSFNINCKRMQRLIDNIVDITKLDVGFKVPKYANYDIVYLVEEMTLSVVNYAKVKEIEIIFDTDIEELYIKCDLDMIERIVLNLISNAIKFSNKGSYILVEVSHDEDFVSIKVADRGIGIDPEIQDKIFDRFVQGDKSIRREKEGSGIGLSLVKSFVDLLEGKIYLRSDGKNGSEFTVLLPNKMLDSKGEEENPNYNLDMERVQLELSDIYELHEHSYNS